MNTAKISDLKAEAFSCVLSWEIFVFPGCVNTQFRVLNSGPLRKLGWRCFVQLVLISVKWD